MWSPPVPAPSVIPVAREGVWDVLLLLPGLPGPGQSPSPWPGLRGRLQGLGKAKCQTLSGLQSHLGGWVSSHLCLLCPGGQCLEPTAPRESPQQTKPVAKPYLSRLGLPAWSHVPGLSVFIASICAVLWAHWPAASAPRLGATIPSRPTRTQPGQLWDQACTAGAVPCAPHPTLPLPGQARA